MTDNSSTNPPKQNAHTHTLREHVCVGVCVCSTSHLTQDHFNHQGKILLFFVVPFFLKILTHPGGKVASPRQFIPRSPGRLVNVYPGGEVLFIERRFQFRLVSKRLE